MPSPELSYQQRLDAFATKAQTITALASEKITPDTFLTDTKRIAEIDRPSGSVHYSLGPVIAEYVNHLDAERNIVSVEENYKGTRNTVVSIKGSNSKDSRPFTLVVQGDQISAIAMAQGTTAVPLSPNHQHRQDPTKLSGQPPEIRSKARAVRTVRDKYGKKYHEVVAEGYLVTDRKQNLTFDSYHGAEGKLKIGDRVVYRPNPVLTTEGNIAKGKIDNDFGIGASLGLITTLTELLAQNPDEFGDLHVRVVFDDREESVAAGNLYGDGAKALALEDIFDPEYRKTLYTNLDGHDVAESADLEDADGALVAHTVSDGTGHVTDEDLLRDQEQIMEIHRANGGIAYLDQQVPARTSRSSENGLVKLIPQYRIRIVGYAEKFPHHDGEEGIAMANIQSGVETGKFLTLLSYAANVGLLEVA